MTEKTRAKIARLEQEIVMRKSQDLATLYRAIHDLSKCGKAKYMASGLIISIKNLGGETVVNDFMIMDGLSDEGITTLKNEVEASIDVRLCSLPKLTKKEEK